MKCVILAGGFGTRIGEETKIKPKSLIEIGNKPILWHIMKIYSFYDINEFVICCGYKAELIKKFCEDLAEPWKVIAVDTGLNTMTGGRIKRVKKYLENDTFCLTYGDDLKRINISNLIAFHKKQKKFVTLSAAQPPGRFGILKLENNSVVELREKPPGDGNMINGGYYVLEPEVFDYISGDSTVWENESLRQLIKENQISAYKYTGLYQPMDTLQDKKNLENLWNSGDAYWKVWC
ncbi:MAG: NTP transferase domain-containing protein [Bacteroidetes bacterium]|nr:NTP transferase domain-containing protein [Bacteroidota bacterium]